MEEDGLLGQHLSVTSVAARMKEAKDKQVVRGNHQELQQSRGLNTMIAPASQPEARFTVRPPSRVRAIDQSRVVEPTSGPRHCTAPLPRTEFYREKIFHVSTIVVPHSSRWLWTGWSGGVGAGSPRASALHCTRAQVNEENPARGRREEQGPRPKYFALWTSRLQRRVRTIENRVQTTHERVFKVKSSSKLQANF